MGGTDKKTKAKRKKKVTEGKNTQEPRKNMTSSSDEDSDSADSCRPEGTAERETRSSLRQLNQKGKGSSLWINQRLGTKVSL